jgi:hypothetical protein
VPGTGGVTSGVLAVALALGVRGARAARRRA